MTFTKVFNLRTQHLHSMTWTDCQEIGVFAIFWTPFHVPKWHRTCNELQTNHLSEKRFIPLDISCLLVIAVGKKNNELWPRGCRNDHKTYCKVIDKVDHAITLVHIFTNKAGVSWYLEEVDLAVASPHEGRVDVVGNAGEALRDLLRVSCN